MTKYISVFFLTIMVSVILFFMFLVLFGGGVAFEIGVQAWGFVFVVLLSFLISQLYYVIDLIKKKWR